METSDSLTKFKKIILTLHKDKNGMCGILTEDITLYGMSDDLTLRGREKVSLYLSDMLGKNMPEEITFANESVLSDNTLKMEVILSNPRLIVKYKFIISMIKDGGAELINSIIYQAADTPGKSDFFARLSHDMRTPMNVIIGLTSLTLDEADNPAAVRENMSKLRSMSDYLQTLLNDILDMSGIENGTIILQKQKYSYMEFMMNIKCMFKPQCDEKNITFDIEENPVNQIIYTDKTRLDQIFFNVMSNAVKYTNPGGKIDLFVRNLLIENGTLSANFIIQDTGIGMSYEYQKHLFVPFDVEDDRITPELKGSGLGLSITKRLVEMLGGRINIDSKKGNGTRVTISLSFPCETEDAYEDKESENYDKSLNGKNVLLVEDHPLNAQIAGKLLEKKNMMVCYAQNGKIALDKFAASQEFTFDIILMDIRMPEMSGFEATRKIRSLKRRDADSIPIIAMSANAYPEDVRKSIEAGMNDHLAKPINSSLLYETITKYIS